MDMMIKSELMHGGTYILLQKSRSKICVERERGELGGGGGREPKTHRQNLTHNTEEVLTIQSGNTLYTIDEIYSERKNAHGPTT